MINEAIFKRSLAAVAAILVASPVFAQSTATSSTTTTQHSHKAASDDSDSDSNNNASAQDATTTTTTSTSAAAPVVGALPAAVIVAEQPKTNESSVRLIPALGSSSFTSDRDIDSGSFRGLTAALFADFGNYDASFETGIETFASRVRASRGSETISVNSWGIPLFAKWNMSGKPQETVYLKGGAMPFFASGADTSNVDFMGVAGVGGNIPLGRNSSLMLDVSYNRLFNNDGALTNYQGVSLLGGLSVNL